MFIVVDSRLDRVMKRVCVFSVNRQQQQQQQQNGTRLVLCGGINREFFMVKNQKYTHTHQSEILHQFK